MTSRPLNIIPRMKRQRPPRSFWMTIAAGFRCADGVLICADTQETFPDYLKTYTSKISTFQHEQDYRLALSGAGESDIIEMVFQEIVERLRVKQHDSEFVERTIRDVVYDVTAKHVIPFPKEERPWFHLIIAVQANGARVRLFKTSGSVVRWDHSFACVGEVALAHYAVKDMEFPRLPMCVVRGFAVHMLKQVKDYSPNCGKYSEMVQLYDDWDFSLPSHHYLDRVEVELGVIDNCCRYLFSTALAHRGADSAVNEAWEHLQDHIKEFQAAERARTDDRCRLLEEYLLKRDVFPMAHKADAKSAGEGTA